jgi:hypothetical protein
MVKHVALIAYALIVVTGLICATYLFSHGEYLAGAAMLLVAGLVRVRINEK